MEIKILNNEFSICKINNILNINFSDNFCFIGKTDEEISLVCSTTSVPKETIECDNGWRGFRVQGVLDFSLIGILSKITTILADNQISVFAISTFNTDYILIKEEHFSNAISILQSKGYQMN